MNGIKQCVSSCMRLQSLPLHIAAGWLLCQYITLYLPIHCWWAFGSFQLFAITNNVTTNIFLARPLVKALLVFYGLGWVLELQTGSKPEGVPGADFLQGLEQGHSPEPVYTCAINTSPNVSGSLPASFQLASSLLSPQWPYEAGIHYPHFTDTEGFCHMHP